MRRSVTASSHGFMLQAQTSEKMHAMTVASAMKLAEKPHKQQPFVPDAALVPRPGSVEALLLPGPGEVVLAPGSVIPRAVKPGSYSLPFRAAGLSNSGAKALLGSHPRNAMRTRRQSALELNTATTAKQLHGDVAVGLTPAQLESRARVSLLMRW
jgi:hypothetical protein